VRNSLLLCAAVSLSVLLCSCGFMTPAQQYAGDRKDMSEIAVIQSYHGNPLGDDYHATISGYSYKHTVKCDAAEGKASVFVSQEMRML